jgi:uncharacterized protein
VLRAVLDPGVLVSALLVAEGPPGRILDRWRQGELELVVSGTLLAELEEVPLRPRFASRVGERDARAYVAGIRRAALLFDDPPTETGLTPDPGDDYLVALARAAEADLIVSGDPHLAGLATATPPVLTPRAFADMLD